MFADDVTLEYMLANTDLMFTAFDGTAFATPVAVGTPNNGKYETAYGIESNGMDLSIAWIENSENDYGLATGTNTVYAQTLSGGTWQSVETINSSVPGISSLALGYTGNGREIAYCADTDGNLETTGDTELFINNTNVTGNAADDLNVKYEKGSFWYKSNGGLVKLNEDYTSTDTGIAFDGSYNIIGNGASTAAVFTQSDDFSNALMVAYQNADGTFTAPVSLYDNDTLVNAFSAVMNPDGGITVAMDSKNLSSDPEAASPYTTTDFFVRQFGAASDLAVGDTLGYDRTAVISGGDLELTTTVQNKGTAEIDGFTLMLTDASGNYLADTTVFDNLPSGAQADVSIIYPLPSNLQGNEVRLTATPLADVIETDTTNNTITAQIGLGDLSVTSQIEPNADGALVTTTVTNSGYTVVEAGSLTLKQLAETPELLDTQAIGTLAPGASEIKTYQVSADRLVFDSEYNGKTFISEVLTEQEENDYANNDATATISPVRVSGISISDESMTLALGETWQVTAQVAPANAFNPSVYYISDSTDVVTVDDAGNLTAVGLGSAVITAISADGGLVKSCTVTVQSSILTAGENGSLIINSSSRLITGIDMSSYTAGDIKDQMANTNIRLLDNNGNALPEGSTVGTGCVVQLLNNAGTLLDEKIIEVYGDVNGDGNIDTSDAGLIVDYENFLIDWDPLVDDAYLTAADLNGDGNVDTSDAGLIVDVENFLLTVDQTTGLTVPL